MEGSHFDRLTTTFARAISRRNALRALAGGLASLAVHRASAAPGTCFGPGQACGPRRGCCSHTCCGGVCCSEDDVCLRHGLITEVDTRGKPICCPAGQTAVDRCCAAGEVGCFKTC